MMSKALIALKTWTPVAALFALAACHASGGIGIH
jgi:hypothetical protein